MPLSLYGDPVSCSNSSSTSNSADARAGRIAHNNNNNDNYNNYHISGPPGRQCVRIMQWNTLSFKEGTYAAIRRNRPHLFFLQETRTVMKSQTPAYNIVSINRGNAKLGGGVAIGIDRILTFRNLSHLIPQHVAQELETLLVQVVHE